MKLSRPYGYDFQKRDKSKLWLDKNENLDPIFHDTIKSIINETLYSANYYPENKKIYSKLANIEKINKKNIIFTHGSDGGIHNIFKLLIKKGNKVLLTEPTFAMYNVYTEIFNAKKITIPYELRSNQLSINYNQVIDILQKSNIKLFCLPNPDSPSGVFHNDKFIFEALDLLKKNNGYLLIDEAYYPYYPYTFIKKIKKYDNLFIVRSFSKSFGVAGLRIGYIATNNNMIDQLNLIKPMYEVSSLSMEVAFLLLKKIDKVHASINRLNKGKKYFEHFFKNKGYKVLDTKGNFSHILIPERERKKLKKYCYFRYFSSGPLEGFSRFTSTTTKNFKDLLFKVYDR